MPIWNDKTTLAFIRLAMNCKTARDLSKIHLFSVDEHGNDTNKEYTHSQLIAKYNEYFKKKLSTD